MSPSLPSKDRTREELRRLEAKLGIALPHSYIDFVIAFGPTPFPLVIPGTEIHSRGFLPLEEVDFLERRRPDIIEIEESFPLDSEDGKYFVYGVKQDDVAIRTRYLRKTIVVGVYSQHELLLLNPAVVTKDGEMEAILLLHSSAFRAPSFAELLRQISVHEINDPGRVPPYSQRQIEGSCADKLSMRDIWWE